MKRKKWSETEEQTLLSKYSDLLRSGTLSKLKTREKKFKPIADHVNAVHHLHDPAAFPFRWSWRDVSIKVQNMRHQYLGVKQKIRLSPHHFNWKGGPNHWENFLNYKEVFGDVQLESKHGNRSRELGFEIDEDDDDDDDDDSDDGDGGCTEDEAVVKRLGLGVLRLREAVVKREERRREREFLREKGEWKRKEKEKEKNWLEEKELEMEERQLRWVKGEIDKRVRVERELEEERRRRKKVEEKMEEEEMEWRERMVAMQVEHEKQMMQLHAEACQNQMQVLGVMARILCQFFGSGSDGLGAGLGALPPQDLHHADGLENVKPDANSPSEFI